MRKTNMIFGIVLVIIGLFFLLINYNIIPDLSFLEIFRNTWPLGFVLSGILLIFKQRTLSLTIFILTIILGITFFIIPDLDSPVYEEQVKREITHPYNQNISDATYQISFGAGKVKLSKSYNQSYLIEGSVESKTPNGTKFNIQEQNTTAIIDITREEQITLRNIFANKLNDNQLTADWDLRLNGDVASTINLDYGVSEVFLDLRELNIDNLDIDCGVSNTDIIFGNETIEVDIDAGVSDFNFEFTQDPGIIVYAEGGLVDVNLEDFTKIDNRYFSPNYKEGQEVITINIESGVTTINGRILQ